MNDCTVHRNPHRRHYDDDDEFEFEAEKACRWPVAVPPPSLEADAYAYAAPVHKKAPPPLCRSDDPEDCSAEDPTCELSLSTMETDYGLEGQQQQQHPSPSPPPRFGGRHNINNDQHCHQGRDRDEGSASFTELAFSSMDMDRHGGPLGGCTTEHRHGYGYGYGHAWQSGGGGSDPDLYGSSLCDGMGESMFGESFALDDGPPGFDAEAHLQQRAALQASRSQLCPAAVDEEGDCA